jgi:hypothetical protein
VNDDDDVSWTRLVVTLRCVSSRQVVISVIQSYDSNDSDGRYMFVDSFL